MAVRGNMCRTLHSPSTNSNCREDTVLKSEEWSSALELMQASDAKAFRVVAIARLHC